MRAVVSSACALAARQNRPASLPGQAERGGGLVLGLPGGAQPVHRGVPLADDGLQAGGRTVSSSSASLLLVLVLVLVSGPVLAGAAGCG